MKIQYCSDLHLEFQENKDYLKQFPVKPEGEMLLLAGDIVLLNKMKEYNDFFNWCADNFKTTYWIPGNHEYYYFDAAQKCGTLNENIRNNVHLVNNLSVEANNIRFVFSTLWSKIDPGKQWFIEKNVSDFQVIKYNGHRFSIERFNELHKQCLDFVTKELEKDFNGKTIVATHHVPTLLNYPEQYKNSKINDAFAVELFDLIERSNAAYWIYGHHHNNIPAFKIGNTTMLTNQLGYVRQGEHKLFNHAAIINV